MKDRKTSLLGPESDGLKRLCGECVTVVVGRVALGFWPREATEPPLTTESLQRLLLRVSVCQKRKGNSQDHCHVHLVARQ